MKKIAIKLTLFLLVATLLSGCFSGKVTETRYYLLSYIPEVDNIKRDKPLPIRLRIREFDIAEAYRRSELIYRQSAHELQFYNYQRWAIKPERLVTEALLKHIKAANIFEEVNSDIGESDPDYILDGVVQAIEEYDNNEKWYAHLELDLKLKMAKNDSVVWRQSYNLRSEVSNQEPVFVVRTLSSILEGIGNKALVEWNTLLSPKKND
ncbi:ABC-type transport auxiliary lipoprotein family protein [Fibrobacterales bacterium]|nr:ABC-type transport auxiliary lipoprotein family protein [Fibrobacterales bacterium]